MIPRSRERGHIEAELGQVDFNHATVRFRAHVSAATLKPFPSAALTALVSALIPRSRERGHIEATTAQPNQTAPIRDSALT